jgi:hypothetical protein
MHRLRKTCLGALLFVASSFQFDRFIAAQSPQAPQQRQEPSGAKAQAAEQKQPDYSQEAYVIERMTTSYRFEKDGAGRREQILRVKVQSDAGVESFGQIVFPYSSANEKLDIEQVTVRKGAKYTMTFPDETATKLIRRGTLTCQPNNGECSFVLLPPEEITSVD